MASWTREHYGIPDKDLDFSENDWDQIWQGFQRWLTPPQGKSLIDMAASEELTALDVICLAGLQGRGYTPPHTPNQWREIYRAIQSALPGGRDEDND